MRPSTKISLIRHGEVHNPDGIFYGHMPRFRLSDRGVDQARQAARLLSGKALAAVISSPLLRARQTAREIVSLQDGVPYGISRLITEVKCPYEGWPGAKVDAMNGDVYSGSGPEFEQPADLVHRMRRFIRRIQTHYPGRHVAAVSHGDPIIFTILWALNQALTPAWKGRLDAFGFADGYPALASVTTLTFRTDAEGERPGIEYVKPY